jgi:thiamine biosynthesis lipoprotein
VELCHGGVATSGTAARGAHLYDPATGSFVQRTGSVTVVGPSLMWADVWATALFVGPASLSGPFSQVAAGYRVIHL